ncbi:MAG: diguanylate cyclase [Acetobacterium sp.]
MNVDEQAIRFIRNLVQLYFKNCDLSELSKKIKKEKISWIGTGAHEIGMNFNEVTKVIEIERTSWEGCYEIIEQWYKAVPIGENGWVVYGELSFREVGRETFLLDRHTRFSMVCEKKKEGLRLTHAHFSEADVEKNEHDSDHQTLISDYDLKLETALKKRTELLVQNIEALRISQMRYEIAMENTDVIIYDYIVKTKKSIFPESIWKRYDIQHIVEDTVETVIKKGIVHPKSVSRFREIYEKIDNGEPFAEGVIAFIDKDGVERINEIFFTNIFDDQGNPMRAIGVLRDVTEQKILQSEKKYQKSMTQDKKFIYEANISQNSLNTLDLGWAEMLGLPKVHNFSDMIHYVIKNNIHPDYIPVFKDFNSIKSITRSFNSGETKKYIQYPRKGLTDNYIWTQNTMNIIRDDITGDIKIRCYLKNIHEKKEKETALIYKSEHDMLTGLYNKGTTENLIKNYLGSAKGRLGRHGFFIIDIDYFKDLNDSFGHLFGDNVLTEISGKIRDAFRENDIIGRIGGDEFVVFMKNIPKSEVALFKAKQLCNRIKTTYCKNSVEQGLSASVGMALYPDDGKDYKTLCERADTALYVGKKNGRNQFTLYEEEMLIKEKMKSEVWNSEKRDKGAFYG